MSSPFMGPEPPSSPTGPPPALPPETGLAELPFNALTWENFESLSLHLADREADQIETRRYGTPGQAQSGIDVYSRLKTPEGQLLRLPVQEVRDVDRIRHPEGSRGVSRGQVG
jgi:hypothetical protein